MLSEFATVNTNWVAGCFLFEELEKMHDFQGYFSGTFQEQSDFSGLFRSWNCQQKIHDFPGGVVTRHMCATPHASKSQVTTSHASHVNIKYVIGPN